ncbi:MAG: transglutaminase family protein [Deltaproteobacteria bacterium]
MRSVTTRRVHPLRRFRFGTIPVVLFLFLILFLAGFPEESLANPKRGTVTVTVDLNAPPDAKQVRLWIPYPMSDRNQSITDVAVGGNYTSLGVYREGVHGEGILFVRWDGPTPKRTLTYSFRVERKEAAVKEFPSEELPLSRRELDRYLSPTRLGPTDGKVAELAARITEGKGTVRAKARAIYDWIVENMRRDPEVKGCGLGEVNTLLSSRGGKCADIHSVFVALARASGVPAREVFGLRLPPGKEGEITGWQHCWAEFYLPGAGWVPVDPADVRKAILTKKISLEEAKPLREYYFGAVDANRVEFGTGRDLVLNPPQEGGPLNYFMYPYAEVDGVPLNEDLYGQNLGYRIVYRER